MKKVILRFMFAHTDHAMQIVTTEDDARNKIELWRSDKAPHFFSGYDQDGDMYYAIRSSEVSAMLTLDLETLKAQQEEALRKQQAGRPSKPPGM
jgi:hypothetical protein